MKDLLCGTTIPKIFKVGTVFVEPGVIASNMPKCNEITIGHI